MFSVQLVVTLCLESRDSNMLDTQVELNMQYATSVKLAKF